MQRLEHRTQPTDSLLREYRRGNQESWHATFREGSVGVVHWHSADRSTISGTRSGTRSRRQRNVRAGAYAMQSARLARTLRWRLERVPDRVPEIVDRSALCQ